MSARSLLARLLGLTSNTTRRPCRLGLELLEGRLAPATLTVNSTADTASPTDPYLSLREAIGLVNSPTLPGGLSAQILGQISGSLHAQGADRIVFDPTQVSTPITLTQGQLELSLPGSTAVVTIDGSGGVTVDGNNASRVLKVDGGVQATLNHLTITHGQTSGTDQLGLGGGVYNAGTLNVTACLLQSNTASGLSAQLVLGTGGGIYNAGILTVTSSTITSNHAENDGCGIGNSNGATLTVLQSTLSSNWGSQFGNFGGGISNRGRSIVIGSTFEHNQADRGGGISNVGTLTVSFSTFHANGAEYGCGILAYGTVMLNYSSIDGGTAAVGGGILNYGTMTINGCTINGNTAHFDSGGIYNAGLLTVSNSTLAYNSASIPTGSPYGGGGISNDLRGTLTVANSTLTGNWAGNLNNSANGGGISNSGSATVSNSTLSGNSASLGGGIFNNGTLGLQSTIVAGNSAVSAGPDVAGTVLGSSGYNLIGDNNGLAGIGNGLNHNQIGTDLSPLDPALAPLGYYGGPGQSCALLPFSPALGTGDPASPAATDQRGQPRAVSGLVDVGAFQSQANPFVVTTVQDPGRLFGLLSLREAVNLANVLLVPSSITFDPALSSGTVNLSAGPLELAGVGGVQLIDGGNRFTVDGGSNTRLVQVDPGIQAVLRNLRLGHGSAYGGGAVLNQGTLTVGNSTLFANSASQGGAIYNDGTLTVTGCTLMFNQAQQGGGLYDAGVLTASNSTFVGNVGNDGGALYIDSAWRAVLSSLTISQNQGNTGAGLDVVNGLVLLRNCIVCGNSTGVTDLAGTVSVRSSYNLIGTGGGGLTNGVNHNLVGVADPGLTTPDFNSPLTPVFGFTSSSPALGAGDPTLLNNSVLRLDQHGNVRGSPVNIGAM
jgi:hypothetical protein